MMTFVCVCVGMCVCKSAWATNAQCIYAVRNRCLASPYPSARWAVSRALLCESIVRKVLSMCRLATQAPHTHTHTHSPLLTATTTVGVTHTHTLTIRHTPHQATPHHTTSTNTTFANTTYSIQHHTARTTDITPYTSHTLHTSHR